MVIFGIDPGSAITGWGAIRVSGNSVSCIDCGVIRTKQSDTMPQKLACIYAGLMERMADLKPQRVCVEEAFYAKNVHTTLVLGQARGVAIVAAVNSGAEVAEYSPREIKKSVVGNGNAAKDQVEYMIKMMLSLSSTTFHADTYDALAAALCDFQHLAFLRMTNAIPK